MQCNLCFAWYAAVNDILSAAHSAQCQHNSQHRKHIKSMAALTTADTTAAAAGHAFQTRLQ
jgi:hypothetical protein